MSGWHWPPFGALTPLSQQTLSQVLSTCNEDRPPRQPAARRSALWGWLAHQLQAPRRRARGQSCQMMQSPRAGLEIPGSRTCPARPYSAPDAPDAPEAQVRETFLHNLSHVLLPSLCPPARLPSSRETRSGVALIRNKSPVPCIQVPGMHGTYTLTLSYMTVVYCTVPGFRYKYGYSIKSPKLVIFGESRRNYFNKLHQVFLTWSESHRLRRNIKFSEYHFSRFPSINF